MAERRGALDAGAKVREFFSTPYMQKNQKFFANRALPPGAAMIGPAVSTVSDFVRGLMGSPGSAPANAPARAAAAPPAAAPAQSAPAPSAAPSSLPMSELTRGGNPTFSELAAQIAAANGGKVSLRQLGALSDIAYKTSPRQVNRTPTFKDLVGGELLTRSQEILAADQARAIEMMKTDPKGGQDYGRKAVSEYMGRLQQIMGADPMEQMLAAQYAREDEGE